MAKVMKKDEIIQELRDLLNVLSMDSKEYAAMLNEKEGGGYEPHDTYPYRIGVAKATIEYVLGLDM